jgi:tetratricopeptide (TPR) repeat protein
MPQFFLRRILIGLCLASLAFPAFALPRERDSWLRVQTDHFTFFSNASERSTRRIATNLERFRDVLIQLNPGTAQNAERPIFLYVFDNNVALSPYKPLYNGKPANIAGYFFSRPEGTYMVMQDDAGDDIERLLYHEYLHHVLGTNYGRLPLWFNEGMAELYSTFKANDQTADIGGAVEDHIRILREGNMIPLARLFAVDYQSKDYNEGYRQGIFYAQSWALVHYLLLGNPARHEQTIRFFQEVANGTPALEAFRGAYQTTEAQIEKELRDYVQRNLFNYRQFPVKPAAQIQIRLEPLPREETLTRLGELLLYQRDATRLSEATEHFRAALAVKPGYGPAQIGLCRLESEAGRAAAALACFDQAAQAAPNDFSVQYQYAYLLQEHGAKDAATQGKIRTALTRAAALQPDNAEVWTTLASTYVNESTITPEALRAFETAYRLRPEGNVAQYLVLAYVRSGQGDKAAEMIEKEIAPRLPGDATRVWQVWANENANRANSLLNEQKLDEALPILEDVVRRAPAAATTQIAAQLAEIRRIVGHNSFVQRYNEVVALLNAQKIDEALPILKELSASTTDPQDLEMIRQIQQQVDDYLKARKGKKKG